MGPFGFDPAAIPSTLINGALEREAWAQSCLAAHAGRVFAIVVGPLATTMRIDAAGRLAPTSSAAEVADLTLIVSPTGLPALLANPGRWDGFVTADGVPHSKILSPGARADVNTGLGCSRPAWKSLERAGGSLQLIPSAQEHVLGHGRSPSCSRPARLVSSANLDA